MPQMVGNMRTQVVKTAARSEGAFRPASNYRAPACESVTSSPVAANRKPRLPTVVGPVDHGKATPVQDLAARLQARRRSQEKRLADMEARLRNPGTVNPAAPSKAPTPQVWSQASYSSVSRSGVAPPATKVGSLPASGNMVAPSQAPLPQARSQAFSTRIGLGPQGVHVGAPTPATSGNHAAPKMAPISRARSSGSFARTGVTPPPEPQVAVPLVVPASRIRPTWRERLAARTEPAVAEVLPHRASVHLSSRSATLPSGGSSSVRQHGSGVVATSSVVPQPWMKSARTIPAEHASRPAGVSSRKRNDEPRRPSLASRTTGESSCYQTTSLGQIVRSRAERQASREILHPKLRVLREERLRSGSGSHLAAPPKPESPPTEPAGWSRRSETRLGAGSVAARTASAQMPASMSRTHEPFDRRSSKTWVRREAVRQQAEMARIEAIRQGVAKVAKAARVVRFDDNVQVKVIDSLEEQDEDEGEPDLWLQIAADCESDCRRRRQASWTR